LNCLPFCMISQEPFKAAFIFKMHRPKKKNLLFLKIPNLKRGGTVPKSNSNMEL
jgi:hypothetical protein